MTLLAGLALRSTVVLTIGLLLNTCLTKRSAALRHRVLATSLLAAALVMPVSLVLPEWTVTLPVRAGATASTAPALLVETPGSAAVEPDAPGTWDQRPRITDYGPRTTGALSPLVIVWLAGALAGVTLLITGLVRVWHIAARASRIEDPRWLEILDTVSHRYRLTRPVAIARTDSASLLATWGIARPLVLVPRHARDWTADRVHVVLAHELAHVRRHDWIVQIGAELVRAILWFNPLAWIVCRRLRRECEQACDDEVLGTGVGGRAYAGHLIALARQCRKPNVSWASALPMAHPSTLERRIAAMLNPRLDRRVPSRRALAALAAVLLLVTIPAAAVRARQAVPATLSGTIYDVTGGVLPGVEVALVDANGVTSVAASNASGRFEFPAVAPGHYVLDASLPGFRSLRHEFELREPRDWHRAVTLQVAELMETVRVQASRVSAPLVPSPAAAPAAPVRVGGNVRPPRKVRDVRPVYPPAMREAGLTGIVPIEAIIGRDGSVSSVRVLSAQVHPDLAIAAAVAVRQWVFTPTLLNGVAVEVVMTVSVSFDLEG